MQPLSTPSSGSVLIVSGPPGAGKSTISPLVAARLGPLVACIEADWFWTTITSGFIPPWEPESDRQNRTVLRSVISAAAEMAGGGYQVVVDGIVGPWHLPVVTAVLDERGIELDYVVLRPDLATCLGRALGRAAETPRVPGHPPLTVSGPIRHLWSQFSDLGTYEAHVIDTANGTAETAADTIGTRLAAGELRVTPTGQHG